MCYKVECSKCGKFTWNGCGKHVASVYDGIEKGKHCTCKSWPGVDTKGRRIHINRERRSITLLNFSPVQYPAANQFAGLTPVLVLQVKQKLELNAKRSLVLPLFD